MPIDLKMAWRNLWRNPRRTVLTVSAIAFASLLLVFMLSFQLGSYETMINAAVKLQTGHLQVQAAGYHDTPDIRKVVAEPENVGELMEAEPSVSAWTPRSEAFSLISSADRTYGAMVVGIDPRREPSVSTLADLIRDGTFFDDTDAAEMLVGRLLARNLNLAVGDELTVLGQGRDGSVAATVLTVRGIFSSGQDDFDRSVVQMPLGYFSEVYFMRGAVHKVVGVCDRLSDVAGAKAAIAEGLDDIEGELTVLDWDELMPGLMQAISMDLIGGLIFWLLLIIVVAFSILNTFLMAVFERTRELGVMMAIGTRPGRLSRIILAESGIMTLVGVGIGVGLGCLVTLYFESRGIDVGGASELLAQYGISGRMYPRLSVVSASLGPAMVLIITLLAALWPAWKVRRLTPVAAMSHT